MTPAAACEGVRAQPWGPEVERLLDAVLDASNAFEQMVAPPGCSPDEHAKVKRDFDAARTALLNFIARTTAGQADASPPNAAATVDPRLLKSEPASGTPSPEEAAREGPGEVERRQVSPGDLGAPVRFEIEHDSGAILRFRGEDAARHVAALNRACRLAEGRMEWPTALPEVIASAPDPRPAGCVCPVERVRREVRACPVHGERE